MSGRSYEDYEELGKLLQDAGTALADVARKLMDMFPVEAIEDEYRRPAPSRYDEKGLDLNLKLDALRGELALEFQSEISGSEVPPGKPRTPRAFQRGV